MSLAAKEERAKPGNFLKSKLSLVPLINVRLLTSSPLFLIIIIIIINIMI
jgi:hypothetical protein